MLQSEPSLTTNSAIAIHRYGLHDGVQSRSKGAGHGGSDTRP